MLLESINACRGVLHEVKRRVDTFAHSTVARNELRRTLRAAELGLTAMRESFQNTNMASAPATSASASSKGRRHPNGSGASIPPLPKKDEQLTRPTPGSGATGTDLGEKRLSGSSSLLSSSPTASSPSTFASPQNEVVVGPTAAQTVALWTLLLSVCFWRRRKLMELAMMAIELLHKSSAVPWDLDLVLLLDPSVPAEKVNGGVRKVGLDHTTTSSFSESIHIGAAAKASQKKTPPHHKASRLLTTTGSGLWHAISECVVQSFSDASLQLRALSLLHTLLTTNSKGSPPFMEMDDEVKGFCSHAAMRVLDVCFAVVVEGASDTVRREGQRLLGVVVGRITHSFVQMNGYSQYATEVVDGAAAHCTFATHSVLEDYTVDVDHEEPYTAIQVISTTSESNATASETRKVESGDAQLQSLPSIDCSAAENATTAGCAKQADTSANEVVNISMAGATSLAMTGAPTAKQSSSPPLQSHNERLTVGDSGSFDPRSIFCSSIEDSLITDALSTLNTTVGGGLPDSLKDLLMLLRRMCQCASRPCSGAPMYTNTNVRCRDAALWVLECTLGGLPAANCELEHKCSTWMALVLHACKYELMGCLAVNLATSHPFSFFERSVHLLGTLLRKFHFHVAREVHTLLGAFLFPLMSCKYAAFRQKHAVLTMIQQLFSVPHLCISLFLNYDCNPAFDAGAEYGGLLELLIEHVTEVTIFDYVDENGDPYDWLTSDQQQLLRTECIVIMHTFMTSLHTWMSEDPKAYALRYQQSSTVKPGPSPPPLSPPQDQQSASDPMTSVEAYLDNWTSDDTSDGEDGATLDARSVGESDVMVLRSRNMVFSVDADGCRATNAWGKHHNILYHWKHIHYLLHNKRITQEAVQLINDRQWKAAKLFLEERRCIASEIPAAGEDGDLASVTPGSSSYAAFARFLHDYPGISRESISAIFDHVNRSDPAPRLVLMEYLHCFNYVEIPIDTALRDTTCKFMSWDRPMFEAKVWETIQTCFGAEYARQNPNVTTAKDADTMAGVLLFLHSNLHNDVVKGSRLSSLDFVRDANACLDFPMATEDLLAMYQRVLRCKWQLDVYGRTPQQSEKEQTLERLSAKIRRQQAAKLRQQAAAAVEVPMCVSPLDSANPTSAPKPALGREDTAELETQAAIDTPRDDAVSSGHASFATLLDPLNGSGASVPNISLRYFSHTDVALLDNTIPSYTVQRDAFKLKEQQHQLFYDAASLYLKKLESVHRVYSIEGEAYRPQPYVVPHYAEHVRQILLLVYPHLMACVNTGFRVLEGPPIASKLLDTMEIMYDIAAAFVLNLRDLRPVMEETLQRYIEDPRAYRLLPPSRATFVPFVLNII